MPRFIISFGFKDGFINSFDKGLGAGTTFKGLSKTGYIKTFLAGTKVEAGVKVRAGI
jgi:hypothetical protein